MWAAIDTFYMLTTLSLVTLDYHLTKLSISVCQFVSGLCFVHSSMVLSFCISPGALSNRIYNADRQLLSYKFALFAPSSTALGIFLYSFNN